MQQSNSSESFTQSIYDATKPLIRKRVPGGVEKVETIRESVSSASQSLTPRHLRLCNLRVEEADQRQ